MMLDLYFLHKSVVKEVNDITKIFFLFNFKSENKAFFTISILSFALNKYFLFSPSETATITLSNSFQRFLYHINMTKSYWIKCTWIYSNIRH
jgi:hypothetical protein